MALPQLQRVFSPIHVGATKFSENSTREIGAFKIVPSESANSWHWPTKKINWPLEISDIDPWDPGTGIYVPTYIYLPLKNHPFMYRL